jgi:hypothetical protein
VSDEQERARIVLESHGRAGGKMRAAIEQARRDTIEEVARWLVRTDGFGGIRSVLANELRAALLGKQVGEVPTTYRCKLSGKGHVCSEACAWTTAPAPAEGAGEVCGACRGKTELPYPGKESLMSCDCVTNSLREHPDCYDHTNECVADRVDAAEAKGYLRALGDALDRRQRGIISAGDAYVVTVADIDALKKKVKP